MENHRREVNEIIEKLKNKNFEIQQISTILGVTQASVYAWMNGTRNIKIKFLNKLRSLEQGSITNTNLSSKIAYTAENEILLELKTKIDFLIEQNVGIRVDLARTVDRIAELEEKKKTKQKQDTSAGTAKVEDIST